MTTPRRYEYVECRAIGHAWEPTQATRRPGFVSYMWMQCTRCETIRKDVIDMNGRVTARWYKQPHGYRNPGYARGDHRKVLVTRVTRPSGKMKGRPARSSVAKAGRNRIKGAA